MLGGWLSLGVGAIFLYNGFAAFGCRRGGFDQFCDKAGGVRGLGLLVLGLVLIRVGVTALLRDRRY